MISTKNALVCTVVLLLVLTITAVKGNAAPAETSHWNSNTFGNLNTLADTTTVTFSIEYNETGTIEWFKDGVLADTLSGATSAQFTTSWSTTGMKEVKARMTNGGGTSAETVWPVEVQETGTATLLKATIYPQPRISGNPTLDVTEGWVNFPTLYLKTRDPENWIEYVSSGTYILKADIDIRTNAILKADDGSAKVLKICAVPKKPGNATGTIRAYLGGTINIDSMTIMGWNRDMGTEISNDSMSAVIRSRGEGTLKLTNSVCRHIEIHYESDMSPGDLLDHNDFNEANPFILNLSDSKYQVITNNRFYHGRECNVFAYNGGYGYNLVENNQFIGSPTCGDNFLVGQGSRIIGNEFTYAGWNLAEIHTDMFCRNNVLHDNGGNHNGFNGMIKNIYSYNDYWYDFTGFSGFYSQLKDDLRTYPTPEEWYPDHIYVINGRANNVPVGFNFFGGHDIYVYNFTCSSSCGNLQYGSDRFFVRKSSFTDTRNKSDFAFRVVDYASDNYGFVGTATVMDSVFSGINGGDFGYYPAGNAIFNIINCIRKDSEENVVVPTNFFYKGYVRDWGHPEMRYYVWLDVLVKDLNGHLIKDANVTMECLNDPSAPTLKVTLPPPPPDLRDMPAEPLPQPVLGNFIRLKTLSTGKLPGPNYGWSANPEPCVALPFRRMVASKSSGDVAINTTTGYQYRIKAAYHGLESSATVSVDETWLREDPTVPSNTVELVLNGDATTGTDTTPPVLNITSPQNNQPVSGTVTVAATASDNWDIEKLEIFVDNVSRAVISADSCTWTAESYVCSWLWNTAQERDGLHSVKVVARDISGNMTEKTVTVEVLTKTVSSSADDVIVYPNPYIKGKSQGSTCTFANLAPDATVRIYGISGGLVTTLTPEMSGDSASAAWDVSKAGGGIYLYTIHSSKGVQKGKIGIVK